MSLSQDNACYAASDMLQQIDHLTQILIRRERRVVSIDVRAINASWTISIRTVLGELSFDFFLARMHPESIICEITEVLRR